MSLLNKIKMSVWLLGLVAMLTACEGIHKPLETPTFNASVFESDYERITKTSVDQVLSKASALVDTSDSMEHYYYDNAVQSNHVIGIKKIAPFLRYLPEEQLYETHAFYKVVTINLREKEVEHDIGVVMVENELLLEDVLKSMQVYYHNDFISYINDQLIFVIDCTTGNFSKIEIKDAVLNKIEADDYWIHFYTNKEKLSYDLQKLVFKSRVYLEEPISKNIIVESWRYTEQQDESIVISTPTDGIDIGMAVNELVETIGSPLQVVLRSEKLFLIYPEYDIRVSYEKNHNTYCLEQVEGVLYTGKHNVGNVKIGMLLSEVEMKFGKISTLHFESSNQSAYYLTGMTNRNGYNHQYTFNHQWALESIELARVQEIETYDTITTENVVTLKDNLNLEFEGIHSEQRGYILDNTLYFNGLDKKGEKGFYYYNHQMLYPQKIIDGYMVPISVEPYVSEPNIVVQDLETKGLYNIDVKLMKRIQLSQYTYEYLNFK